jgi:hypothetical protein
LPAYLLRRRHRRVKDGDVPASVATIFKLVLGVQATIESMINSGYSFFSPVDIPTAKGFYDYAEEFGLFVSGRNAACGGPPGKIVELLEVAINGKKRSGGRDEKADDVIALIGDLEPAVQYGICVARMEAAILLFQAEAAAAFINKQLRESAVSPEEQESYARLREASVDDPKRVQFSDEYWTTKVDTLKKILYGLCDDHAADEIRQADSVSFAKGNNQVASTSNSRYPARLDHAVHRYEAIIRRGMHYCNNEQQQIYRCLGLKSTGPLSYEDMARRVNDKLYETVRYMT